MLRETLCVCRWLLSVLEKSFLSGQTLRMTWLKQCWTGPLEVLNHLDQMDSNHDQEKMVYKFIKKRKISTSTSQIVIWSSQVCYAYSDLLFLLCSFSECLKMLDQNLQKFIKIPLTKEQLVKLYSLKEVSVCLKRLSVKLQNGRCFLKDNNLSKKLSHPKSEQSSLNKDIQPASRKQKSVPKNEACTRSSAVQDKEYCNRCTYIF